jgi:hypothetical protein
MGSVSNIVDKIKTHFTANFFENRAVYEMKRKNILERGRAHQGRIKLFGAHRQ